MNSDATALQKMARWTESDGRHGEGEYTVTLYGPREYTAWGERYAVVYSAPDPMSAANEVLLRDAALIKTLPRWRVTVQPGRQPADLGDQDLPVLTGTYDPEGTAA